MRNDAQRSRGTALLRHSKINISDHFMVVRNTPADMALAWAGAGHLRDFTWDPLRYFADSTKHSTFGGFEVFHHVGLWGGQGGATNRNASIWNGNTLAMLRPAS